MALRLPDLFTHPTRRGFVLPSRGQKDNRAQVLDNSARISSFGYGIASPKYKDYSSYLQSYRLPWVRACVQVISYNAANIGFRLVKPGDASASNGDDKEDLEVLDSPFLNLLNHPNPYQTGFELRESWWTDLELTGNAYVSLEAMTPRGLPTELYRLNPANVTVLPDKVAFIKGYAYTVNGRSVTYDPSEILHLKYANPLDPFYGMGVIEAGEARFESEQLMAEHERRFWKSGAKITGILQSDGELDQGTFDRIVGNIRAFFQGSGYSTMLLENGLKYQSVSDGPAKLGMLDMALASRDQILALFGVPATKLGILEKANYKADEADRYFWTESIDPKLTRVEDSMQALVDLFHPNQDYRLRFKRLNFSDDLPQMTVAKTMAEVGVFTADEIRQYTGHDPLEEHGDTLIAQMGTVPLDLGGAMATVNERRKDQDLKPIEGGDAFIILPARSVPLDVSTGEVGAPVPVMAPPGQPPAPGQPARPANVVNLPKPGTPKPSLPPAPVAAATAGKAITHVSINAPATSHVSQQHRTKATEHALATYKPTIDAFFEAQKQRVLTRLAAVPRRQKATLTDAPWWNATEEDAALSSTLDPLWTTALEAGVAAARAVGVPVRGETPARIQQLKQNLASRVTGINQTTRDAVAAQVTEGLRRGYSAAQIGTGVEAEGYPGISGVFAGATGYRASMIARTELAHSYLQANLDTYQQSGVVKRVEAQDGTRDAMCADRNGEVMGVDEAMMISDHPNGTLNWVPLIDGF